MSKRYSLCSVIISLFIFGALSSAFAQDYNDEKWKDYDLEYRGFQLSIIPGLSTNGIHATNYASKFSLNLLGGYNGALHRGYEIGGLFNAHKHFAGGVQIAGIGNYSGGDTQGIQFAGIGSYSAANMQGIQFAGIANIAAEKMQGLQFSGILNMSGKNSEGLQFSGLLNVSGKNQQGLFSAGIGNISQNNMEGLFLSGALNIAPNKLEGLALAGALNYGKSVSGLVFAPINISSTFQGIQAGALNISKKAEGIQIGVINMAKDFQGVPVGLISYYGNGRTNIDIWSSDGGFTNVGVKLGTNEIYNMVSIGYNTLLDRDVWQLGWSIGRLHEYSTHFLYTDLSYFKINEGGWTSDLNSNIKYRLLFGKELAGGVKVYGGPSLNLQFSKLDRSKDYTWYRLFDFDAKGTKYIAWLGFSIGMELF